MVSSLPSISPLPASLSCCCGVLPFIGVPPSLSSSALTLVSSALLLLLVFGGTSAFNQDLSSWNVGKVTDMNQSESSVRSLLLLLPPPPRRSWCPLFCLYLSLPAALLSLSLLLLLRCSSLIGIPPSLSSSPLTLLVSSAPSSS